MGSDFRRKQEFCYISTRIVQRTPPAPPVWWKQHRIALKWIEVDRQSFGTARVLHDLDIMEIQVGTGQTTRCYRVRVGRVREWCVSRKDS
jgi:hypothetical protein